MNGSKTKQIDYRPMRIEVGYLVLIPLGLGVYLQPVDLMPVQRWSQYVEFGVIWGVN